MEKRYVSVAFQAKAIMSGKVGCSYKYKEIS